MEALCGLLFVASPSTLPGWCIALYNIQLTNESITANMHFGRFRIAWDKVERISIDDKEYCIGENK
jgi:hypothetical protein